MLLLPNLFKKVLHEGRNLSRLISWLTLNVLQTQFVSTFGVALTIRSEVPIKNICTVI